MKQYNFDEVIDRTGFAQLKWEAELLKDKFGTGDLLSFWISDMDFRVAPEIQTAVEEAAKHGVYGYCGPTKELVDAYLSWMKRRHGWEAKRDWFSFDPSVLNAISVLIASFSEPGDDVLIQPPVYNNFANCIRAQGRRVLNNPLLYDAENGTYTIDFDDFEKKTAQPSCKIFILCNPHNPTGRVFTPEELRHMGDICNRNGVFVISDEIHCDLIAPGQKHTVFASLGEAYADNCAMTHAASKTFNIGGLQVSCIMIPNQEKRQAYLKNFSSFAVSIPEFFGNNAAIAAWKYAADWVDACMEYVVENAKFLCDKAEAAWGGRVIVSPMEGTYNAWVNFNGLVDHPKTLESLCLEKAKVALNQGSVFGPGGDGFVRINLACPRVRVAELMERLEAALPS